MAKKGTDMEPQINPHDAACQRWENFNISQAAHVAERKAAARATLEAIWPPAWIQAHFAPGAIS